MGFTTPATEVYTEEAPFEIPEATPEEEAEIPEATPEEEAEKTEKELVPA